MAVHTDSIFQVSSKSKLIVILFPSYVIALLALLLRYLPFLFLVTRLFGFIVVPNCSQFNWNFALPKTRLNFLNFAKKRTKREKGLMIFGFSTCLASIVLLIALVVVLVNRNSACEGKVWNNREQFDLIMITTKMSKQMKRKRFARHRVAKR